VLERAHGQARQSPSQKLLARVAVAVLVTYKSAQHAQIKHTLIAVNYVADMMQRHDGCSALLIAAMHIMVHIMHGAAAC
jgi:hypothetical protein